MENMVCPPLLLILVASRIPPPPKWNPKYATVHRLNEFATRTCHFLWDELFGDVQLGCVQTEHEINRRERHDRQEHSEVGKRGSDLFQQKYII